MKRYYDQVIKSFRDRATESVFQRRRVRRWSREMQRMATRRLLILDAAEELADLRIPPGNRLEKLAGNRTGQYSLRINRQWRLCFRWHKGNAYDVEITDYH